MLKSNALNRSIPGRLFWYALLGIPLLILYWRTLLHGVGFWGDSAELQFVGKVLGIPHAPGYPLYVMLNYLFVTLIPLGSLATRVNLLSACFTLLSIFVFFEILLQLKIRAFAALIAALTFGLTYTQWFYALIAEVYSLNILFVALVILFLLRWHDTRADRDFYIACLLYALSFGNHQLMIALLPSFVYFVWVTKKDVLWSPTKILVVVGCVLLGFSQYLYIIVRSNDPGTPYLVLDTQTFLDFLKNPGAGNAFHLSLSEVVSRRLPVAAGIIWSNFYILLFLAIWGIFLLKDRQVNIFLLSYLLINTLFVLQFEIREADAFFSPGFLVMAIYVGLAINRVLELVLRSPRTAWLALVIPLLLVVVNYRKVDQSQHTRHAKRVEEILRIVDRDAIIITDEYDYSSYLWYYLIGEGYGNKEIFAIPMYGVGKGATNAEEIREYLSGEKPIYSYPQRLSIPPGKRVYVLWRVADELRNAGLQVTETRSKYVYEVSLPVQSSRSDLALFMADRPGAIPRKGRFLASALR
jgi:hypothetical protein